MHKHTWDVVFYGLDWKAFECKCGAALSLHGDGTLYCSPRLGVWVKRLKRLRIHE
jgi:hypothetical protein